MSASEQLNDINAINSLFLEHQIHSLKISDQRSLLDSLAPSRPAAVFNLGDYVRFREQEYWVEEINRDNLLLKNKESILFKHKHHPELKKMTKNRIVIKAGQLLSSGKVYGDRSFELRKLCRSLQYKDSRHFAAFKGSQVKLMPHQLNTVAQVLDNIKHRFLIADEVGLGKTIEAGLLLKEFRMRYGYKKIIIIVPASLQLQWQHELWEKFRENFTILSSDQLKKKDQQELISFLKNNRRLIVSLDFAKQEHIAAVLTNGIWDMVVFDEAHRLKKSRNHTTAIYKFAEAIAYKTKSFFMLSATPFAGKLEELYFLIHLLDKDKTGSLNLFLNEYYNKGAAYLNNLLKDMVIRRTKRDVGGFTKRHAVTVKYKLTSAEKIYYDALVDYVRHEYNKSRQQQPGVRALMLSCFLKMLDSSMAAIQQSLAARIAILKDKTTALQKNNKQDQPTDYAAAEEEDYQAWNAITNTDKLTFKQMQEEEKALAYIHSLGKKAANSSKQARLVSFIEDVRKKNKEEKIIIFTQFKATMFALAAALQKLSPVLFHGSLSRRAKDEAVTAFQDGRTILISTEAGGEGRNLQCARIMINYDLPWNPFKIEQRIGRIHRLGQKSDVYIYNFAVEASIGERLIELLTEKINLFEEAFGKTGVLLGNTDDSGKYFNRMVTAMYINSNRGEKPARALNLTAARYNKLAIADHFFKDQHIDTAAVEEELKKAAQRLETFFKMYADYYPEDFAVTDRLYRKNINFYKVRGATSYLKSGYVTFDHRAAGNDFIYSDNDEKKTVEYLHLDHPLIKFMIHKININAVTDAVRVKNPAPERAVFAFLVSFNYYIKEKRYIEITTAYKESMPAVYKRALAKLQYEIEKIKKNIINKNRKLVDDEINKLKIVFRRQTKELNSVLENYEFKNKQSGRDNYFLLIPKVKKHLRKLQRDYEDIIAMTRKKLDVHTGYALDSIELE
ncbi:MAG TPA: SNF2-related protein [Spirochaetota bacterium]|nr:SNF2-related protein [Spirochaetota bacterium]